MEYFSQTPVPRGSKLPSLHEKSQSQMKNKIILKKYKAQEPTSLQVSWTSKLLSWKAILEDQREYRQMITKIELYNQKMKISRKKKLY